MSLCFWLKHVFARRLIAGAPEAAGLEAADTINRVVSASSIAWFLVLQVAGVDALLHAGPGLAQVSGGGGGGGGCTQLLGCAG